MWSEVARGLALTPEEGFVLSLLEAPVSPDEIVALSGLPSDRVEAILVLLLDKGVAESDAPPPRLAMQTMPDLDEPSAAVRARATLDSSDEITVDTRKSAPIPAPARSTPPKPSKLLEACALIAEEDTPEDARESARAWLSNTFLEASPEERATLLWESDGHVLPALGQVPFDPRVAKILGGKTFTSPMLVTNLAGCPTCPASLLTHLLKQPIVRRVPQLRRMLLAHANMPADLRRRG